MRLFIAIQFDKETREKLQAVQQRLHQWGQGSIPGEENRLFLPHITLARRVEGISNPDLKGLMGDPFASQVDTVQLLCSEQMGGRWVYTQKY